MQENPYKKSLIKNLKLFAIDYIALVPALILGYGIMLALGKPWLNLDRYTLLEIINFSITIIVFLKLSNYLRSDFEPGQSVFRHIKNKIWSD